MKLILDIKEGKATFKRCSLNKTQVLEELQEAVENMKLVKEGKLKPHPAKELLNEL